MQSALDQSLLDRADQAAELADPVRDHRAATVPSWMLGAADVRIIFITADGAAPAPPTTGPTSALGQPELEVAAGQRESRRAHASSPTTATATGSPPCRPGSGQALVLAQSLAPQDRHPATSSALVMFALRRARRDRRRARRLGGGPQRPAAGAPAHRRRRARSPAPRTSTPLAVEGDDEIARLATRLQPDARRAGRLPRPAAPAGRRRRPRAAHARSPRCAPTSTCSPRPTAAGGLPPEARAELLDDVRAQIEELTTLIGDLVELARDEPMTRWWSSAVDLAEVVDRARGPGTPARARPHLRRRRSTPWWVDGDAGRLERAVTNLLDNAAKWSPPGGTVTVRLDRRRADRRRPGPRHRRDGPAARLRAVLPLRRSRARCPAPGSGLSIVRQVVERHAGTVSRRDRRPSGGARLTMTLPGRAGAAGARR